MVRLVAMLVISGAVLCASLQIRAVARPVPLQSSRSFAPSMLAKSKKKKRKKPAASTSRPKPGPIDLDAPTFATTAPAAEPTATQPQTSSSGADPAGPAPNVDSVLRAAGLSPDAMPEPESTAAKSGGVLNRLIFGDDSKLNLDDPLSRIPKAGQAALERLFAGGAILFGGVFLAAGLGVSVEAVCKVTDNPLPVEIDELLVHLLILFFFSISLGVLKQLQISSASGGVLYQEDDD